MAETPATPSGASPVTVVVSRTVAPGHESDYHHWMLRMLDEAMRSPNSLGGSVLSPVPGQGNVHYLVHRFGDAASLRAWENSDTRRQLSREADAFSTANRQAATGLETWFSIPGEPSLPPPPKWKMAVATFFVAYVLTAIIIPAQAKIIGGWPFLAGNVIISVLLSVLMTYLGMPLVSRVLRGWLYPTAIPDTARGPG